MEPIRSRITPGITQPTRTETGNQVSDTTRKFEVATTTQTATTQGAAHPVFDQMASSIHEALNHSQTRDDTRDALIDHEVKTTFGDRATPGMAAAISEAFKNDPHLSQLFNQLYAQATAPKK